METERGRTLLLNWVYYRPVGHAAEALKVAKGYADANPGLRVSLLLNAETPVELAEACPWIERAYAIDTRDVAALEGATPSLRAVPCEWDYVATDERVVTSPFPFWPYLAAFHGVADAYFKARIWKGPRFGRPYEGAPAYRPNATVRLELPEPARRFAARYAHDGPRIAVLPAGSKDQRVSPPLSWWTRLLRAVRAEVPGARVYVTGVSASAGGRTATAIYPRTALDRLFRASPNAVDCYDIGLWNQLALLEQCDMLIAPHSGFAFLAPCVGTPWLAISGSMWIESFFNDVPFYSMLPSCPLYPCVGRMKDACTRRLERDRSVLCMDPRQLTPRIPEVLAAMRLLLDPAFTYDDAVALRRRQLREAGTERGRLWSFDNAFRFDAPDGPSTGVDQPSARDAGRNTR